ncbi:hypothetical protein SGFS_064870 [Streptomyces graminofaciens]|uniref:DUF4328 domain-containing protein n=1 Tax=Streptomyces graminofaciens TaxID=68212 RepID=A0ABN5VPZ9_9ACTN|nr:DUF4328 domain-containing protein [Streptomyces graminofaciens]BBC35193.1 hypothetical protein SGFS_064870 [Streptomyces graminofaciens]
MNDHIAPRPPVLSPVRWVARGAVMALALAGAAWVARALWHVRLAAAGMPDAGPLYRDGDRQRLPTPLEDGYHVVSSVGDVATLICALTFLLWLQRLRDNARTLSGRPPRYAGIWVYAGWIIPVANLWIPRGVVADIHHAGAPEARLPRAVNWWWALWLVAMLSGTGLMYADTTDEVIARAYDKVELLLAADAAVIGAAVAAVFVVRALTATQQRYAP